MALMRVKVADLIAECLALGRIHRHAHSGLRFLAKNNGYASAERQKVAPGSSDA